MRTTFGHTYGFRWTAAAVAVGALVWGGCKDDDGPGNGGDDDGTVHWSTLGRDPRSHFHNTEETKISRETAGNLQGAWTLQIRRNANGAPSVVGDRVYVVATLRTYALNAATGDVLWESRDAGSSSAPAYEDGKLYVMTTSATLKALDAETGAVLWEAPIDDHHFAAGYSSPVIADQYVLVGSSSNEEMNRNLGPEGATFRGSIVALDKDSGAEVWRHYTVDPPSNGVAVWSTVSVDLEARVVYGTTGNNYTGDASETSDAIFALRLDPHDAGQLIWNTQLTEGDVFTVFRPQNNPDYDFGTNPIVLEAEIDGTRKKLVGAGQKSGTFWMLDAETGEVVWDRDLSGGSAAAGGILNNGAYDGQRILVASNTATSDAPGSEPANGQTRGNGTSVLFALNPANGDIEWERQLPAYVWAPITVANGVGFVAAERILQAFNTDTGEKLMEYEAAGTIACAPSIGNGRVFFGSGMTYLQGTDDNVLHALALP